MVSKPFFEAAPTDGLPEYLNGNPSEPDSGWHPSRGLDFENPASHVPTGSAGQENTIARWATNTTGKQPRSVAPRQRLSPTTGGFAVGAIRGSIAGSLKKSPVQRHPAAGFWPGQRSDSGPEPELATGPASRSQTGFNSPRSSTAKIGRPGVRLTVMVVVVLLIMGVLAGRLFQVQVIERDRYASYSASQGVTALDIAANRGAILDRNYNVLAISDDRPTIYGDPRLVPNPLTTAEALALVLGFGDTYKARITQRLASDKHFVYIARQVSPEQGQQIRNLGLPGIGLTYESARIRPNGDQLARGVLGAVDIDQNPTAGAEVQFDDELDGIDGRRVAAVSRDGIPLPARTSIFQPPTPGDDIVLSLHTEIQWMVEQALLNAVDEYQAKGATAVLMEVHSGDLLAVASAKRNPETGEVVIPTHNPAYTDSFEPGSVNKAFTIAAVLEEGATTPTEQIEATWQYKYADKVFREPYRAEDKILTTEEILTESSNIGTIKLAIRISSETLYDYLRAFGFGRLTGAGHESALPGESIGILESSRGWFGTQHAAISFGHGVSITAVQLAGAINVLANRGEYVAPRLHLGTVDTDGQFNPVESPEPVRVLSQRTGDQMIDMLSAVVSDGTGKRAGVPGYEVAGKTGTAQKLGSNGQYSDADYVSTFAGFLPADNPRLSVVVILDEPRTQHIAGLVAAPLFSEITEKAMRILKVAPGA